MLVMMPEVINQRISSKHPAERSFQYIYIQSVLTDKKISEN